MKDTIKSKRFLAIFGLTAIIVIYLLSFVFSLSSIFKNPDDRIMTDVARLVPERVMKIEKINQEEGFRKVLKEATEKNLKVSISGSQHSQGGHTYYKDGVVLDMTQYNKILNIDDKNKTLKVQSGAKWSDVQREINPHGLAVDIMQSSNVFTIGGTLSVNAHGRDLDRSSVVESVKSFRLMMASGKVVNVSREENPKLFQAVIGGYGLFGIILDVTLRLVDNTVYEQKSEVVDYKQFPEFFYKKVKANPNIKMMLARPSIAKKTFVNEIVVATWQETDKRPEGVFDLTEEKNVLRDRFFFGLSRQFDWAKDLRWNLQKKIELGVGEERVMSRTNAMRPPLAPIEFLDYYSESKTDVIQEYYVPTDNFVSFMDAFRDTLKNDKTNVISFTIRYVKANNETMLSYAPKKDAFAIIQMSNVGLSDPAQKKIEATTQKLVKAATTNGGTYYLTYQLYPTREQMRQAYPRTDEFFALKKMYDPDERFMNEFYEKYAN